MDIVGSLPQELVERILCYLQGGDLLACSKVSKLWKTVSSTDFLWKKVCKKEFPYEMKYRERSETREGDSVFMEYFRRGMRTLRNWSENKYWVFQFGDNVLGSSYIANGAILILVKRDSHLWVYDLNNGKCEEIQRLGPLPETVSNRRNLKTFISGDTIALEHRQDGGGRTIFVYKWNGEQINFCRSLSFTKDLQGEIILCRTGDTASPQVVLRDIVDQSFVLYDSSRKTFHFWDLQTDEETGKVVKPPGWREYSHKKHLFLCSPDRVNGYDKTGTQTISLCVPQCTHYTDDVVLHFNKEVMMVEAIATGECRTVFAWTWNLERLESRTTTRDEVCLHPRGPYICYVLQNGENERNFDIVTKSMDSGRIVSSVRFSLKYGIDHTFYGSGHLSLVHSKFALYLPGYNTDFYKEQIMVDLNTNRMIFTEPSKTFKIEYVGGKLIEGKRLVRGRANYEIRVFT